MSGSGPAFEHVPSYLLDRVPRRWRRFYQHDGRFVVQRYIEAVCERAARDRWVFPDELKERVVARLCDRYYSHPHAAIFRDRIAHEFWAPFGHVRRLNENGWKYWTKSVAPKRVPGHHTMEMWAKSGKKFSGVFGFPSSEQLLDGWLSTDDGELGKCKCPCGNDAQTAIRGETGWVPLCKGCCEKWRRYDRRERHANMVQHDIRAKQRRLKNVQANR